MLCQKRRRRIRRGGTNVEVHIRQRRILRKDPAMIRGVHRALDLGIDLVASLVVNKGKAASGVNDCFVAAPSVRLPIDLDVFRLDLPEAIIALDDRGIADDAVGRDVLGGANGTEAGPVEIIGVVAPALELDNEDLRGEVLGWSLKVLFQCYPGIVQ